jgi:predicted alpha/beta-fold hydrolase
VSLSGHLWTLWPTLRHRVAPLRPPPSSAWSTTLEDPDLGPVALHGRWSEAAGATSVVVVVHGLGGSYDRPYCVRAARAAAARGWSCLRLALRGADRSGEDFYHAGLIADVEAALRSPEVVRHERVCLLGFSLGGHLALRLACARTSRPPRAVAAICPPLDLERTCQYLDHELFVGYRRHLLNGLIDTYLEVARRRTVPTPPAMVRRVRGIREFDSLTVVPRFGFASAEDYYARESVAPRLRTLRLPALVCASENDPMVPARLLSPQLASPPANMTVRWIDAGGHVAFPPDLDLGFGRDRGLEHQVLSWLSTQPPIH